MYNYLRQDRTDKYPDNVCTTTVDLEDPMDIKFLAMTLNIYHLRNMNDYFLYILPNSNRSENARFKGITADTMTRG